MPALEEKPAIPAENAKEIPADLVLQKENNDDPHANTLEEIVNIVEKVADIVTCVESLEKMRTGAAISKENTTENAAEAVTEEQQKQPVKKEFEYRAYGSRPDGWVDYLPIGGAIEGTPFVPFKTPLTAQYTQAFPGLKFDVEDLFECAKRAGECFGLIIDLTFTWRYYNHVLIKNNHVAYRKIKCGGHNVEEQEENYNAFKNIVDFFRANEREGSNRRIGVHCTHGLNRTGFLVCRYMIEEMGWNAKDAILAFGRARGLPLERENYVKSLKEIGERLGQEFPEWDEEMSFENRKRLVQESKIESWLDKETIANYEAFRASRAAEVGARETVGSVALAAGDSTAIKTVDMPQEKPADLKIPGKKKGFFGRMRALFCNVQ
ncbi:hypothetical protein QR680_009843 [Steinernema hermaphroditum]|uniref:Tyrosine specific protein phosphatases domain-containing protein n=1 Tax=Steinernema hermaphroditum TaxID=289476 RepID=A0AA39ILU5_9BILA|nr:hypothetical protein QR680_009839 [Steinernema hermaphroditum]KAK0426683.1 hypothetical protein QR680_009843 [Steinernema hermaphroditum]